MIFLELNTKLVRLGFFLKIKKFHSLVGLTSYIYCLTFYDYCTIMKLFTMSIRKVSLTQEPFTPADRLRQYTDSLLPFLDNPEEKYRLNVLKAIQNNPNKIDWHLALPRLLSCFKDPSDKVRSSTSMVLELNGKLLDDRDVNVLSEALKVPGFHLQFVSARLLGLINSDKAINKLIDYLSQCPPGKVRKNIIMVLQRSDNALAKRYLATTENI